MYCDIPDFGRCCFCLPLRRGILIFGYINVLFSAFLVGLYSYFVHYDSHMKDYAMFHGVYTNVLAEVSIFIYCIDVLINCLLVYGAHQKITICLKIFYYYTMMTCVGALVIGVIQSFDDGGFIFTSIVFCFSAMCIQVYLLLLVRSLLRRLEIGGQQVFDNQLHSVVSGENGVYNNTTVVPNALHV